MTWPAEEAEEFSETGRGTCSTGGCEEIGEIAPTCSGGLVTMGDTGGIFGGGEIIVE